jgi:UDP-sulfoquinovose synthase
MRGPISTAMAFRNAGHEVFVVDNYLRRKIATATDSEALMPNPRLPERAAIFKQITGYEIRSAEGDCCDFAFLVDVFKRFAPEAVVHYAEQPSAPYSMMGYDEAHMTLSNILTINT